MANMLKKSINKCMPVIYRRYLSSKETQPQEKSVLRQSYEEREQWIPKDPAEELENKEVKKSTRQLAIEEERNQLLEFDKSMVIERKFKTRFSEVLSEENKTMTIEFMLQPWNLTPKGIKKMWDDWQLKKGACLQSYIPERVKMLGPDLAVTHFILYRGGKIKFLGHNMWHTKDDLQSLPNKYNPSFLVEAINFDDLPLHYEGVENITMLRECRSISLRNTKYFDDWNLDRLSGNNLPKLEELDLSGTDVTHCGLECVYKFQTLKSLIIDKDNRTSIEDQLVFAMIEELRWDLQVIDSNKLKQDCQVLIKI